MSASAFSDPGRDRRTGLASRQASDPADPTESDPQSWIGVDFAQFGSTRPTRALLPLVVMALILALGVASLRIDLIRTRYALAAAMAEENELIAEQHALIVRKRKLVDPVALAKLARERGFLPAEAVRSVVDPMPGTLAISPRLPNGALPHVAAAPPRAPASSADVRPGTSVR